MATVLEMPFLTLNNAEIHFNKQKLNLKFYTIDKAVRSTKMVKLINKKDFVKVELDKNIKCFILYISFLSLKLRITIHLAKKTQISLLLIKKVTISAKITDFANIVLEKSANILPEQIRANKHAIKLK